MSLSQAFILANIIAISLVIFVALVLGLIVAVAALFATSWPLWAKGVVCWFAFTVGFGTFIWLDN